LPALDVTDPTPIALPVAGGKLALVASPNPVPCSGAFPDLCTSFESLFVDVVGYGNAEYYEGLQPAPALAASSALSRARGGCTDINSNGSSLAAVVPDFTLDIPLPRNTASVLGTCAGPAPAPAPALSAPRAILLFGLIAAAGAGVIAIPRRRRVIS
jgi:hypothetical protein